MARFDLLCIQETRLRDRFQASRLEYHARALDSHCFINDFNNNESSEAHPRRAGVATVIKSTFPGASTAVVAEDRTIVGHYLVVQLRVEAGPLYIHNVYAPVHDQERRQFYRTLCDQPPYVDGAIHLVLGDFNVVVDPSLDSHSESHSSTSARPLLQDWLFSLGVNDAWRMHHPDERVFSGPRPRVSRLDYIFVTDAVIDSSYVKGEYFTAPHGGDHLAHALWLSASKTSQGRGYWKMPRVLLQYPLVREAIVTAAQALLQRLHTAANPGVLWIEWKKTLKRDLQAVYARIVDQDRGAVEMAAATLEAAMAALRDLPTPATRVHFQTALREYEGTLNAASSYHQDSAFDQHAMQAEAPTSFFFRPVTAMRRIPVAAVRRSDGIVSEDPNDVVECFRQHWGDVLGDPIFTTDYQDTVDEDRDTLLNGISRRLSPGDSADLDDDLTATDLSATIRRMRGGSTPGLDGLPASVYQLAPEEFGAILAIVFRYQFGRGCLLRSQRKTCISFLFKKGDRVDPGNYRPIALMDVDVKILTKTLASRLRPLLPTLINEEQQGFVSGRSLHNHLQFLSDVQHAASTRQEDTLALFLDFEKAYDRVNWRYMSDLLRAMNFGESFIRWVQILYSDPMYFLQINGRLTQPLKPTRGVKQGDPLSPLLFLLTIEPLGNLLRSHPERGLSVGTDRTVTGVYFADDSTILTHSAADAQAQLDLVEVYCSGSGARINMSKCVLLNLCRGREAPGLAGVKVLQGDETVKFLGLQFGPSSELSAMVPSLESTLYTRLRQWKRRARTLQGRLLIAQTILLSTLWHYTAHIVIPDKTVKTWQRAINVFVLSRRTDPTDRPARLIRSGFLYLRRADGGLQLPDIAVSLRRQQLRFLQRFCRAIIAPSPVFWVQPAITMWQRVLSELGPTLPLDFLSIAPGGNSSVLQRQHITAWWDAVWILWHETRWPVSSSDQCGSETPSPATELDVPVWKNSSPRFHISRGTKSGSLLMVADPELRFRLRLAKTMKLRSLKDVFAVFGRWPIVNEFLDEFSPRTREWAHGAIHVRWLLQVHADLTTIARRCSDDFVGWESSPHGQFPVAGVVLGPRARLFPFLTPAAIKRVITSSPVEGQHPVLQHFDRIPHEGHQSVLDHGHNFRRHLLPVFHDVWMRILYYVLPVGSRFWWLQRSNPDAIVCPHPRCTAVETYPHRFLDCPSSKALWEFVWADWRPFFECELTWMCLVSTPPPPTSSPWYDHRDIIDILWHMMRLIVIRVLWIDRNKIVFEEARPRTTLAMCIEAHVLFAAHYRALLRRSNEDELASIDHVLRALLSTPTFGAFFATRKDLLAVRRLERSTLKNLMQSPSHL